jgi:hypothetical protein
MNPFAPAVAPRTFYCDSCKQTILPEHPRIHCLICYNYDLCATCGLGEQYSGNHVAGHHALIYKRSGCFDESPVPATPVKYVNVACGAGAQLAQVAPAHAAASPSVPTTTSTPGQDFLTGDLDNATLFQGMSLNSGTTSTIASGGKWGPFFLADTTPTQIFKDLVDNIFRYLDSAKKGYIEPETLSRLEEDLSHAGKDNLCISKYQSDDFCH